METITAMERVPTDGTDRPKDEVKITGVTIFTNPFADLAEEEEAAAAAAAAAAAKVEGRGEDDPDNKVWPTWRLAGRGGGPGGPCQACQHAVSRCQPVRQ